MFGHSKTSCVSVEVMEEKLNKSVDKGAGVVRIWEAKHTFECGSPEFKI